MATSTDRLTLKERVGKLEVTNLEIHKTLGAMDERTKTVEADAKEMRRAIYGYDKTPGMLHDVATLIEKMDDVKKLMWAILVIVLGTAIGGVILAIQHAAAI